MKKLMVLGLMFFAGMVAINAQAEKKACSKSKAACAKAKASSASASTVLEGEALNVALTAAEGNEMVEKRVCEKSGSVSFVRKEVCAKSGNVSFAPVEYAPESGQFVKTAASASKSDMKACCAGAAGRACCKSGNKAKMKQQEDSAPAAPSKS